MRTGTEFIKLPIILFTTFLLASCGSGGPTPEDTSTDVARKFLIHFYNEEYEEAGEYCLGSNYSYDVMRGYYEHIYLPEIEKHFDNVDDYIDAIDFDSSDVWKRNARRQDVVYYRELHGVEVVEGTEWERITFRKRLDGSPLERSTEVVVTKDEGVWKTHSEVCVDINQLSVDKKKRLGIDE